MDTEQVTFSEIKLSQVQVCFEGSHIGRLERAVGYDENLDFWGCRISWSSGTAEGMTCKPRGSTT